MKNIPITETPLIIRTDFSDQDAWEKLTSIVQNPADPFIFNIEFLNDREYNGATVKQLLEVLPADYPHSFIVVADNSAIQDSEYPLLVVDLLEERGREFRALAAQIPSIENNLSIGNMGFEEFSSLVDETGVFRGIPGM